MPTSLFQELVAQLRPQPCVPSSIRRLPTRSPVPASTAVKDAAPGSQPASGATRLESENLGPGNLLFSAPAPPVPVAQPPAHRPVIAPLAPQRYKVQFTANAETHEKLLRAQELLRSQIPDGDVGEIVDRALTALLNNLTKRKFAATERPRESGPDRSRGKRGTVPRSRHIPAEVKRTVWARDGGQCAFVAHDGWRCTERAFLEFHHVVPHCAGGEATVENMELRCRAHNGFEAEMFFGRRNYRPRGTDGDVSVMTSSNRSGPS